ncbi:putative F-box protein (Pof7) [Aspergillus homomorphus CBS 101889]|uniref:F-box protein n=1 Tax=Aspergillus homomorphus (strain CBS 101889) TaxID=1450537 RepID=A0A395I8A2_ASPHC|nr:F-box protein [Aspergillus homomorphus CBS 101889]RAL15268.1 F-box protein [Aspergillus homomorphus CBS 101889]
MEDNAELESFRRQWREEVAQRTKHTRPAPAQPRPSKPPTAPTSQFPSTRHEASQHEEEHGGAASVDHGEIIHGMGHLNVQPSDEDAFHAPASREEPKSALEHFERAVEKEAEGKLGDSVQHYRKAYRLDSAVDKTYRNKYFAAAWKKPAQAPTSGGTTGKPADQQSKDETPMLPTPELIASFAHLPIPQAEPLIENTPPPPCPISHVPSEVLVEIFRHVALMDPATLCRMALVCKRFAYHFAHEQHIWRRLCQGSEFGFKSMHYSFACDLHGNPEYTLATRYTPFPQAVPVQIPEPFSSWSEVFQVFPRIRYTGIYISTVNYTRPGAAAAYQNVSWNSPIHIVTYYRYLRFYPDGSVVYLLTTVEPRDVVPHISKENVKAARATTQKQHPRHTSDAAGAAEATDPIPHVALEALRHAHRGRWRLTKPVSDSDSSSEDAQSEVPSAYESLPDKAAASQSDPRDLIIETEGVGPKYMYLLQLSLRSTPVGKSNHPNVSPPNPSKNTKLAWKGYWSYNKLTDDWAEFGLKNDRSFVFRRVRGWGMH